MNTTSSRHWRVAIAALLLIAWALRLHALPSVPPGLSHDEAANGHDSAAILRGVHRLYFPVGYGREPLYTYSVAAVTALLGQSIFTLRFTSVLWSVATWLLTVALARRWWGRGAALCTGAALALGFWPLMLARVGLRAVTLPPLLAASALAYDHATRARTQRRAWPGYGVAGLCLSLSLYTYMASRGMPLLYLSLLAALGLLDRATLRHVWAGTLAVVVIAGLVSAPLFLYLHAHPELEQRIAQLGGALTAARAGDFAPLWANVTGTLPMLLWRGDPHWIYNVGGRAALEPFIVFGFLVGLGVTLARPRDGRNVFALLWLAGGLAPALITAPDYSTLHAIAALPPTFLLAGRGLAALWQHAPHRARPWIAGALAAGFLITGADATRAYFVTWGQSELVRTLYHHHVVELGRHLETLREPLPVVITSLTPGEFHDPYVIEVTLRRDDLAIHWVDGSGALFYPAEAARLYVESQTPLTPELRPDFSVAVLDTVATGNYQGFNWDANTSWATLTSGMARTARIAPGDPPPSAPHEPAVLPLTYGETVTLRGVRLSPEAPPPGDVLTVITAWQVAAPYPEELVLFAHLLSPEGDLIAQVDRLDAPNWQWQPGDRFVQLHRLALPSNLPPGEYALALGFYRRSDSARLGIGETTITRAILPFAVRGNE